MKIKFIAVFLLTVTFFFAGIYGIYAQEAKFAEINGTVEVKTSASAAWQPAVAGSQIDKEMIISTGLKSSAVISIGSSMLTVSALSMLSLEELLQQDGTEESVLFLRTGRVKADVTPPTGMKAEFTVRSPTTTASVRGTSFSFNGQRLYVHSGKVAFTNNSGQKVYVNKNQRSYADTGKGQRLALPFETESAGLRPAFNDLDGAVSRRDRPNKQNPQINIVLDW